MNVDSPLVTILIVIGGCLMCLFVFLEL